MTGLLRGCVALPLRVATLAARTTAVTVEAAAATALTAATLGVGLVTAPIRRAPGLPTLAAAGESAAKVVSELVGAPSRRCWGSADRVWVEVRGLADDDGLAADVLAAVRAEPGVVSAHVNHPLSRLVVQVADDEPSSQTLCDIVAAAESRSTNPARGPATDLPGDGLLLAASWAAVAVNGVGLCAALAGRAAPWPRLPVGLTALVTVVDYQPRLRRLIEDRIGPSAADAALAVAAATVYAVTQSPASLAADLLLHVARTAEIQSAARTWDQHEPALAEHVDCPDARPPTARPRPLPPGPVERHADRCAVAQAVATPLVGAITRNLNTAATAAVVAAPKAARTARESFASTLARGLADQHQVLPLCPEALRRLDRVDAVLVDPRVLNVPELTVGRIRGASDAERAAIWQWAQDELGRSGLTTGWRRVKGHRGAQVLVRHAHHPLASALLAEARAAGSELVSLDTDGLDDLRSPFDDLRPVNGSVDAALVDAVRHLQDSGRTVAVLSTHAAQALSAADVAIGLIRADGPPPWHADLLVDDLAGAWQIVHALPAARKASRRGVEISTGASLLGALLMVPGVRGLGPGPVTAGAAAGLWTGYRLARSALGERAPRPAPTREWHAMSVEQVRGQLPTLPDAAPQAAHQSRLTATARASASAAAHVVGPVRRAVTDFADALRDELSDPLTPVLAVGAAASAVLGSPVDAVLVGSVLAGNASLAATQRVRAERLLKRLLAVQDPTARRLRGDAYDSVPATRLRPGDVIEVRPGEVVPADARIVAAVDVEVDESALTGESLPVTKQVSATPGAALAERSCMLYAATTVVAGTATAVVTAVGAQTQARRATDVPRTESAVGLQTQLKELTNKAWPISLAGGALVSGLGLLHLQGVRQAISSGVAVSVAAVPEGLPLVATLAQQASARRLTKLGVLVRSPRAVEALGRVDVVCFDKTGTLSENRLTVSQVYAVRGVSREQVLACAARATPPRNGDQHEHATDAAVAAAAPPSHVPGNGTSYLPFRSGRPFSASVAGRELSIKGAPEVLLAASSGTTRTAERTLREMAAAGLRVIAVAQRTLTTARAAQAGEDPDAFAQLCGEGLTLVGLLGIADTPRAEAADLLANLDEQGLSVRLITGDHPVTAKAMAAQLGMAVGAEQVISGAEWDALPRRGRERAVIDRIVFARMSPEHKVQIVQTLERMGKVCAMVGDGANDAAAIRAATVGIGVASHGSDPARTAADVMLLDGRIGSLLDALDEGRQLWRRVQAAVAVLLGGNAGEVAFAILGTAITGRSPLNTRQLLLVNMLTDALPAAALAVSAPNSTMRAAGRGPDQAALWRTVGVRGATTAAAATTAWVMASMTGRPRRASTVALVALVSTQLGQTLLDSRSPLVVVTAVGSLAAMGAVISTPGLSQLLGSTPLGPVGWSQALGTAALATATAAVAPRVLGDRFTGEPADPSTISTRPARHSTAYNSRNGTASTRATTSVNGSELATTPGLDTSPTVEPAGVQMPNTP